MSQHLRDGYDICTVRNQNGGCSVPKRVRIDVRQTAPAAEIRQPLRYAIRTDRAAVFAGEHKTGFDPPVSHLRPQIILRRDDLEPYLYPSPNEKKKNGAGCSFLTASGAVFHVILLFSFGDGYNTKL